MDFEISNFNVDDYNKLKMKYRALELDYSLQLNLRNHNTALKYIAYACDNIENANEAILDENYQLKQFLNQLYEKFDINEDLSNLDEISLKTSEYKELLVKYEQLNSTYRELEDKYRELLIKYDTEIEDKNNLSEKYFSKIDLEYFADENLHGKYNYDEEWKTFCLDELIRKIVIEENELNDIVFSSDSIIKLNKMQIHLLKNEVKDLKKMIRQLLNITEDREAIKKAYEKYRGDFSSIQYSVYYIRRIALESELDDITEAIIDKIGKDQFNRLEDEIGYGKWIKRDKPKEEYKPFDVSRFIDGQHEPGAYEVKFPRPTEEWH